MSKLAFVFPGQGSQKVGMLSGFNDSPNTQNLIALADEALEMSLSSMIEAGPAEDLGLTVNTQPAMVLTSMVAYQAWVDAKGPQPSLMAGHSLGEYSALCAAHAFPLKTAVRLVRFRAQSMQDAVPVGLGGMAAIIGLSDEEVQKACADAEGIVEAVNFNSPGQVVIAGEKEALNKAVENAKAMGARRAILLPVSAPFHSSLLKPAAINLERHLRSIIVKKPQVPIIANVDLAIHEEADGIKTRLSQQVDHAVQWVKTIEKMKEMGITHIVECGPGKVLTGLIKRIDPEMSLFNVFDQASLEQTLEALKEVEFND